jgi:hypothetical protein
VTPYPAVTAQDVANTHLFPFAVLPYVEADNFFQKVADGTGRAQFQILENILFPSIAGLPALVSFCKQLIFLWG